MEAARDAIVAVMSDGGWYTLRDIETDLKYRWLATSISARLRELRRLGFKLERRPRPYRQAGSRAEEYRLVLR